MGTHMRWVSKSHMLKQGEYENADGRKRLGVIVFDLLREKLHIKSPSRLMFETFYKIREQSDTNAEPEEKEV